MANPSRPPSRILTKLCAVSAIAEGNRQFCPRIATVAPTTSAVGPARGLDQDGYNITNSFETGFRQFTVGGNRSRYSSDVNFGNGIRLLGSRLSVNSKDGHGKHDRD